MAISVRSDANGSVTSSSWTGIVTALSAQAIEETRLFEEAKLAEVVRLLGDIGHDVKNMLSPILMGAGIMHGEIADFIQSKPDLREDASARTFRETCMDVIGMQRKGAHRIQDRMKEFADCVKGLSEPPNFAPCKVADVVKNVLETLRLVADGKGIAIKLEGLDTVPSIQSDERRLYNADFSRERGRERDNLSHRSADPPAMRCRAVATAGFR